MKEGALFQRGLGNITRTGLAALAIPYIASCAPVSSDGSSDRLAKQAVSAQMQTPDASHAPFLSPSAITPEISETDRLAFEVQKIGQIDPVESRLWQQSEGLWRSASNFEQRMRLARDTMNKSKILHNTDVILSHLGVRIISTNDRTKSTIGLMFNMAKPADNPQIIVRGDQVSLVSLARFALELVHDASYLQEAEAKSMLFRSLFPQASVVQQDRNIMTLMSTPDELTSTYAYARGNYIQEFIQLYAATGVPPDTSPTTLRDALTFIQQCDRDIRGSCWGDYIKKTRAPFYPPVQKSLVT